MASAHPHRSPLRQGALLALLAAAAFGGVTPIIAHASQSASPLATAALLYAGAALAALILGLTKSDAAPLRREHLPRIALVALLGAGIAPTALVAGLQRTGASTGSLLLNFEAVFTVLLAWALFHEAVGRRVVLALAAMTIGGVLLAVHAMREPALDAAGVALVILATLAWAADNALSRPLSELRALSVVSAKSTLGALATSLLALALHQAWPNRSDALLLLICGATGYGLSLALYLRAQHWLGAARTASIFSVAPFIGALIAIGWSRTWPDLAMVVAAALFAFGVYLHITERHSHKHAHDPLAHEHLHRHDDGHHDHAHADFPSGEHSHAHDHKGVVHEHEHAPDAHHHHLHR
jgi:drug/metabolite transporter (DMT)-like permease